MSCPRCHDERSCGTSAVSITYHTHSEVIGESECVTWHRGAPRPVTETASWSVVRGCTGPSTVRCSKGNQAPLSIQP